jgi:hypothetical protein
VLENCIVVHGEMAKTRKLKIFLRKHTELEIDR